MGKEAGFVEYALLVALIAIVAISAVSQVGFGSAKKFFLADIAMDQGGAGDEGMSEEQTNMIFNLYSGDGLLSVAEFSAAVGEGM